jgi:hypothetical protein
LRSGLVALREEDKRMEERPGGLEGKYKIPGSRFKIQNQNQKTGR